YIVMELVEGQTLDDLLDREARLDLMSALRFTAQLCAALAYAHRAKVIHRDVKPGNIFITPEGVLKLADFGLARILHGLKLTRTSVRGTPLYMAPEQIRGTDLDFRTDLYAVGCVMYEMVTGSPPFIEGDVYYHHVHTPPRPPSEMVPELPESLDVLILSCLHKDKRKRVSSAEHIRQALIEIARSVP
ncbi:MAG: protein kinase, partial [Myxococcota bacterium]